MPEYTLPGSTPGLLDDYEGPALFVSPSGTVRPVRIIRASDLAPDWTGYTGRHVLVTIGPESGYQEKILAAIEAGDLGPEHEMPLWTTCWLAANEVVLDLKRPEARDRVIRWGRYGERCSACKGRGWYDQFRCGSCDDQGWTQRPRDLSSGRGDPGALQALALAVLKERID